MNGELETYEHLGKLRSYHFGQAYIREAYDSFNIDGPDGRHTCLVHPPLHLTVNALQRRGLHHRYNEVLLRETLLRLLRALDFLHSVTNVVHTGMLNGCPISSFLQAQNLVCSYLRADIKATIIMLTIDDKSILTDFDKAEQEGPSPRKAIDAHRAIYASRQFRSPKAGLWGEQVLCDFGQARIGSKHRANIQPEVYKAPEVLFEME